MQPSLAKATILLTTPQAVFQADVSFETPKRSKIFPPGQDNSSGTPLQRFFLLGDVLGSVKLHDFFTNKKRDIPKAEAKFLLNRFTISPLERITF
jgi:hypothetical protein